MEEKHLRIIFFDGVCPMCNRGVNFLISKDKRNIFAYAPLEGITAREKLSKKDLENMDTIIYMKGNKTYKYSDAVIKSLSDLGGLWKLFLLFKVLPKFIRDGVYKYISKNRYKWFGKKKICQISTPKERGKILF